MAVPQPSYSSESGSIVLVGSEDRRVLKLKASVSDATTDFYPTNLRSTATLKPGETFEYYNRVAFGENADTLYRTKLGDALAQNLGFGGGGKFLSEMVC